ALHRENRVFRIRDRLALRNLPDEALTFFCDRDDRRCRAGSLRIRDNHRLTAAHNGNAGIRGSKVDADHFAHVATPLYTRSVVDVVTMNRSPCLTLIRCHLARLKRLPW